MITFILILPLIGAGLSLLMSRERLRGIEYLAVGATACETIIATTMAWQISIAGQISHNEIFSADALGAFVLLFTTLVGFAAAVHSVGHLREETHKGIIGFSRVREYFVLLHLFLFAMFVAIVTAIPLIAWIAIEATTLAVVFLITFYNKPSALEAGWKLLIINSVGLLLGFLGTLLFLHAASQAGIAGTFISWETLRAGAAHFDPTLIKLAFVFAFVGYGTKVGFVPLHTWLPDAHSKAPVPISALLSGVLLNVALVTLLRFRAITDSVVDPIFTQYLLIAFGLASLAISVLIIFVQKNYKRMLAYSSIEHMGFMGLGFAIGGAATAAALFHMLYHALLKPILFFSAGNFFLKYSSTKIAQVRGALSLLPTSATVFLAALIAIAGIPPSGIFFTKLAILSEGMDKFPYAMIAALLAFTLVFAGFIRHSSQMLFGEAPANLPKGEANAWTLFSLAFLGTIFLGLSIFMPSFIQNLVLEAVTVIS